MMQESAVPGVQRGRALGESSTRFDRPSPTTTEPQLITALAEKLEQLYKHRATLVSINQAVRGVRPEPGEQLGKSDPVANSLAAIVERMHYVLVDIERETTELGSLLS